MKKTGSLLLAFALLFTLPAAASAAQKQPSSFFLSGAPTMREVHIRDAAQIETLQEILDKSEKAAYGTGSVEQVAALTPETDGAEGASYNILLGSGHTLYVQQGSSLRKLPQDAFLSLTTQLAADLYIYRALPQAVLRYDGRELALPISQSGYGYKRVDGKFVRPEPPKAAALDTLPMSDGLYIPAITPTPQSMTLRVMKDGKEYFSGDAKAAAGFRPAEPGTYTVTVTARFSDENYKGSVTYRYTISDSTGVTFTAQGAETTAGEAVVLRAYNVPAGQAVTAETNLNFTPTFFEESSGGHVALLPVSVFTQPGEYTVKLRSGNDSETFVIRSRYKQFDVQHLTVAPSTAEQTVLSQAANEEYAKIINPLKSVSDSTRHWQGRFILPVSDKRITTPFGSIRYTNGSKDANVHGAIDFAVPQGTPVAASGSGRVLYAGFLKLTGNTVLIEHGFGLKTWYYHMHTLSVSTGDMVEQGQQIGTVGSTGFSTGPHLHFGMTVNNLSINPYTAIQTDLLVLDTDTAK